MNKNPEKQAAEAYLKLLQNKGASSGDLYRRSLFLDNLTAQLADKAQDRARYADAIEHAIAETPSIERHECLNIAREFYPFWQHDIKAIAAFNLHYGFNMSSIKWAPMPTSLDALAKELDKEKFEGHEHTALKLYESALRGRGAASLVIETRMKMAKILLLRLRDAPENNPKIYRMAVDITLPLFAMEEIKRLFLQSVREFYYSWSMALACIAA